MLPLRPFRLALALALPTVIAACYQQEPSYYSTFPEPTIVQGPPSGEIDPAWQQEQYSEDYAAPAQDPYLEPSSDPSDATRMRNLSLG